MSFNPRNDTEKPVYYIDENGFKYTDIYPPTKTEIAVAQATYDLARATLEDANVYLAAISGGNIPEGYASSKLAALEKAKDNLTIAEQSLKNIQLTAPIAGTIMSLDLNVGDSVNVGATPVTIADLSQPTLEIFLDEADWGNIDPDYEVEVTFDILPDTVFHGKVTQVDPGLYSAESVLAVRAIVQLEDMTADFDLPLGSSASVDVIGGRAENAVLVPIEALHKAGDKYAVFVMENGELRLRLVEVGIQNLQYAEIVAGLEPGDVVSTGLTVTK
jgi:RND family efflux transporter MFP subunit